MGVDSNLQIHKLLMCYFTVVTTAPVLFRCLFSEMSVIRQHGTCGTCLCLQDYLHCAAFSWLCHLCGSKTT